MIQPQTNLTAADNSGARRLMCIRVIGGGNRTYASIGDTIIAVVKDALPNMAVSKSEVVRAVVVRTRKRLRRENVHGFVLMIMQLFLSMIMVIHVVLVFLDQSHVN